jgi:hypothetical protein
MNDSEFLESFAESRTNFLSMLARKIQETDAALAHLAIGDVYSICAVDDAYRRFHDLCGISSTLGLEATCRVARTIDAILSVPFRARRGLSNEELEKLRSGLCFLQLTVHNETRSSDF